MSFGSAKAFIYQRIMSCAVKPFAANHVTGWTLCRAGP